METACKKNNHKGKRKAWSLFTSSLHILLLFKNVFISLFSDTLKTWVFRNNAIPLRIIYYRKWGLSTIENYFSPSVLKK